MAGGSPDLAVAREFDIDERADRLGMPDGRDSADRLTGVQSYEVGVGAPHAGDAEKRGYLLRCPPMSTAGHHQQPRPIGVEDQAVGDGADFDPQLLGGKGGRARLLRQGPDLTEDTCIAQPSCDRLDPR